MRRDVWAVTSRLVVCASVLVPAIGAAVLLVLKLQAQVVGQGCGASDVFLRYEVVGLYLRADKCPDVVEVRSCLVPLEELYFVVQYLVPSVGGCELVYAYNMSIQA